MAGKTDSIVAGPSPDRKSAGLVEATQDDYGLKPKTTWQRIQEVIWDGERSPEEKKLVQKLDYFIM
jgi:hypothetical protein